MAITTRQKKGIVNKRKTAQQSRRTPTPRQERLIKAVLANASAKKPVSKKELLLKAGYSEALSKQPSRILESPVIVENTQDFIAALKRHSYRALKLMEEKAEQASYNDLRQGIDSTRKNVALLEGTATENIGVVYKIIEE